MKKLYRGIKKFIISNYKKTFVLLSIIFLIACIALLYSRIPYVAGIYFTASGASLFRLLTYKTGKIPIVMIDYSWYRLEVKYSGEELEERYKEMCISRATVYLMITVVAFFAWLISEFLIFIL